MQLQNSKGFRQSSVGEIPEEWELVNLAEVAEAGKDTFVDGPFGSDLKVSDYTNDGIMLIQLQNVGEGVFYTENKKYTSEDKYQELIRHSTRPGDIVIAKMSDPVARACIVPNIADRLLVVADCVKLRVNEDKFDKKFLLYTINSTQVRKQAIERSSGSTRLRIRLTELKGLKISMPPLQEQRKISSVISGVDELIQKTGQIIEQTQRLKKGLMQRLLTKGIGHTKSKKVKSFFGKYEEIPDDWEIVKLIDLCKSKPQYGAALPGLSKNSSLPRYIRITDLDDDGLLTFISRPQNGQYYT